jgi:hypothetical protein
MFTLTATHLRRLLELNSFPEPADEHELVFFGLRACIPLDADDQRFAEALDLELADVNYLKPRCTLVQWRPADDRIAAFPGSTVPHIRYVKMSKERNGQGANQLMTGYYKDYRKGIHQPSSPTGHEAFRQTEGRPIRRTADDFDFDNDDRTEFETPYDNLHAAWCMGVNHDSYASAGCQVIVGYPKCVKRGKEADAGPWKTFKENAYDVGQKSFPDGLLDGRTAQGVAMAPPDKAAPPRLRFGSQGPLVEKLQRALQKEGFYEGKIDGDFGERTIRAVLKYQTTTFGPDADDGVVGPLTASTLKVAWDPIRARTRPAVVPRVHGRASPRPAARRDGTAEISGGR